MQYVIQKKWYGIHADILIFTEAGDLLSRLQGRGLPLGRRPYRILQNGREIMTVRRRTPWLNPKYVVLRGQQEVARAGTRGLIPRGFIHAPGLPLVECEYGWGLNWRMPLSTARAEIGRMELLSGWGVKVLLTLESKRFDTLEFLVGCALVFRDWTSRG